MAGSSLAPRTQIPVIWEITYSNGTKGAPIDSRFTISSLANLSSEIPSGVRYEGLLIFVEDEKRFYYFKEGILDGEFIPLSDLTFEASILMPGSQTQVEIEHGLQTLYPIFEVWKDNEKVEPFIKLGKIDNSLQDNWFTISTLTSGSFRIKIKA